MELKLDDEVQDALVEIFELIPGSDRDGPDYELERHMAVQRFCGYDYVRAYLDEVRLTFHDRQSEDTASLKREGGRIYRDEHRGPITTWEELESFEWPDLGAPHISRTLEWYERNLPDDMCIVSGGVGHFCEHLCWLMGYETLCYALYDQRDLVEAIAARILEYETELMRRYLEFDRLKITFASDDMGFKGDLFFSQSDMERFVLEGHRLLARMAHDAGRLYLLHSCGNLTKIMGTLIDHVRIDGKHSFEDTIEDVCDAKRSYGNRIALLGGIDVDFLCRSDEASIRRRVRDTLDTCQSGGGYCLGTGNTVANYIPLANYLVMLDEGRLYGR
jgi:uroporphyrinogen decarboxylase